MNKRITAGTGASLGAILALPGVAHADQFNVTNLNDDGSGSLRSAIEEANGTAEASEILFNSKLSGTIELDDPLEIYESDIGIIGPGARKVTLDGNNNHRIFEIYGEIPALGAPDITVGISGLRMTGGAQEDGGALIAIGELDLTLSETTITGNSAADSGGGLAHVYIDGTDNGRTVIEDSSISGNVAADDGGGVMAIDHDLSVRNSTISGNTSNDNGGGISVYQDAVGPYLELLNSTVTGNEASSQGGGVYEDVDDTVGRFRGSIVAGNSADSYNDLEGSQWLVSFSLVGRDGDPGIDDLGGNVFDVDPRLKPLKNNGGPTDTHAFKKSPAKNKGPSDAPNSDQRGAPRKGKPDIGAYELTKCEGVIVNRVGTAGKDKLKGTKKKDGILGLGGNDKLAGKKGKDGLCGGQGKDKLKGGPGKDKLNGGPGKDKEVQ
jgi:hypothetical protein